MKCIYYDLRRAIAGRWFLAALIATTTALYLSVGQATYGLIGYLESVEWYEDGFWYSVSDLLVLGMKGDFGMLTLPALSTLPFAAQALHEIKSGAIRPAVFRTGRNRWIIGKAAGCVISGMMLQGAAVGLLFLILNGLRCLSRPAVPVLCPDDDRHPLFPGRYDAEPDAVGEWCRLAAGHFAYYYDCSPSPFPETRCAKICLKEWFSVGVRGRHF